MSRTWHVCTNVDLEVVGPTYSQTSLPTNFGGHGIRSALQPSPFAVSSDLVYRIDTLPLSSLDLVDDDIIESGWNLWVWLQCIGVASGCCCKEVYRYLYILEGYQDTHVLS